jgi:hypothetical protein
LFNKYSKGPLRAERGFEFTKQTERYWGDLQVWRNFLNLFTIYSASFKNANASTIAALTILKGRQRTGID